MKTCEQCSEPMEGPHHPGCYLYVDPPAPPPVSVDDLIPLFRDAASVNMTEAAVERQARRFADAVLSLYDVKRKPAEKSADWTPPAERWEIGRNGWDASDEITREDI